MADAAVADLVPVAGTRAACAAVGCAQASWYRRHRQSPLPPRPEPVPHRDRYQPRALAPAERQQILDVLHSGRFADAAHYVHPASLHDRAQAAEMIMVTAGDSSNRGATTLGLYRRPCGRQVRGAVQQWLAAQAFGDAASFGDGCLGSVRCV